jgi:hypothetical protein
MSFKNNGEIKINKTRGRLPMKKAIAVLLVLLLIGGLFLTGCGKTQDAEKQQEEVPAEPGEGSTRALESGPGAVRWLR